MIIVNLPDAQAHLAELVDKAVSGESFLIARGGKPLVKVAAVEPVRQAGTQRIGFMKGHFRVPEDFDAMGADEIADLFEGRS